MSQLSLLEQAAILSGVVFGLVGTALGLMNTFHMRRESRPILRVQPCIRDMVIRYPNRPQDNFIEKDVGRPFELWLKSLPTFEL